MDDAPAVESSPRDVAVSPETDAAHIPRPHAIWLRSALALAALVAAVIAAPQFPPFSVVEIWLGDLEMALLAPAAPVHPRIVILDPGARGTFVLHVAATAPSDDRATLEWLAVSHCDSQVQRLLTNLGDQRVVDGATTNGKTVFE